jgi:hypothetical protein
VLAGASTTYLTFVPGNAIDESDGTNWSATDGAPGDWLQVDLGSAKEIVAWRVYQGANINNRASGYKIQSSPDASTWTDRATVSVDAADSGDVVLGSVTARYWRVLGQTASDGSGFGWTIYTFALYSGSAPGEPVRAVGGGDTASRPADPVVYQRYYDTDLGRDIVWDGAAWADPLAVGGTWTPALRGASTAGTFTYDGSFTFGRYTRLGDVVLISGRVRITAVAVAPAGTMDITGLPAFTVATPDPAGTINFGLWQGITLTGSRSQIGGRVLSSTGNVIRLQESGSGVAVATVQGANVALVGGAIDLAFSGVYHIT